MGVLKGLDVGVSKAVHLQTAGVEGADDIRAVTQECTRILEEEIRRRPECWLWMHNRWRTRPAIATVHGTAAHGGATAEAGTLP